MNLTKIEVEQETNQDQTTATDLEEKELWQCKDFPDVTSESADVCPMDGTQMIKKEMFNTASKVIAKVKLNKSQLSHFKPDFFPVTKMKMTKNFTGFCDQ